jgi:ArsR family transcriptional regulator
VTDVKVQEILRVISHPSRLEILRKIQSLQAGAEVTCSCVLEGMEISQSTLSHHISELVQSGLVVQKPQGRFTLLSVDRALWNDFQQNLERAVLG